MTSLQTIRGTHDLLPENFALHQRVIETARDTAALYGYQAMATPLIEFRDLFVRSVGESSDIVSKEMFVVSSPNAATSGDDKAAMVLRPEGTAAVVRALINGRQLESLPQRLFYSGAMFRYERPQKGRMRQFHQIGAELIGAPAGIADAEIIILARDILQRLLPSMPLRLEINSLGDSESRAQWREALVEYFSRYQTELSETSRQRLAKNPLRILDSKETQEQEIIQAAPELAPYLSDAARRVFDNLLNDLEGQSIDYTRSKRLVRGLDYYSHTVFEFVTDQLGAQGTVLAGGRYDGLVAALGGAATPGIGWAAGIERLVELITLKETVASLDAPMVMAIAVVGENEAEALAIRSAIYRASSLLRSAGIAVELNPSGGAKKGLQRANRQAMRFAILIGSNELANDCVTLRDLNLASQSEVPVARLADIVAAGML